MCPVFRLKYDVVVKYGTVSAMQYLRLCRGKKVSCVAVIEPLAAARFCFSRGAAGFRLHSFRHVGAASAHAAADCLAARLFSACEHFLATRSHASLSTQEFTAWQCSLVLFSILGLSVVIVLVAGRMR